MAEISHVNSTRQCYDFVLPALSSRLSPFHSRSCMYAVNACSVVSEEVFSFRLQQASNAVVLIPLGRLTQHQCPGSMQRIGNDIK
ncbi:unnamed protein product [Protopolystoma xenopodis]|uniref:Uncharacterized protein n=1 Tax=Protopolystoma xenopodis TaxID=117903 RepID=A0A448XJA8_9PLAT|nr:unnamed protein product [Protopolystoma xenopodis]